MSMNSLINRIDIPLQVLKMDWSFAMKNCSVFLQNVATLYSV